MVAVHPVIGLEMADPRLDRRAAPERALDRVAQPTLLAGHVQPEAPLRRSFVALVAGIGDHLLQLGPDRALDVGDHALQRMPVPRVKPEGGLPGCPAAPSRAPRTARTCSAAAAWQRSP